MKEKDWLAAFGIFFIIVGVFYMYFAISAHYIGFHNIDLSYNVLRFSNAFNLDYNVFVDIYNLEGDTISYTDLYITGNNQTEDGLQYGMCGAALFGLGIGLIISSVFAEKVKGGSKK